MKVEFRDLSFCYDSKKEFALKRVNFSVSTGDCIVLCGKSGCGKSSITRVINGLIPKFYNGRLTGSYTFDGEPIGQQDIATISAKVGSVFQNAQAQFFSLNSQEEIILNAQNQGKSQEWIATRLEHIKRQLNLTSLLDRYIFDLSMGEAQLIACASAVFHAPGVILLDEPSANLDFKAIKRLKKLLHLWKKQGITLIIAEHRLHYLFDLADQVIYLEEGKIKANYSPQALLDLDAVTYRQLGLRARSIAEVLCKKNSVKKYSLADQYSGLTPVPEGKTVLLMHQLYYSADTHTDRDHQWLNTPLKLCSGHIYGLLGENGSGKSIFLKLLAGFERKACGEIFYYEKKIKSHKLLKKSYLVLQDSNLQLLCETVLAEILLSMRMLKQNPADKQKVAESLLHQLGLEKECASHPMSLSGGQKQRLMIAGALASDRKIILLDEPTSGLDFDSMQKVAILIKQLAKERVICFASHDPEFLHSCATDLILMVDQQVKMQCPINSSQGEKIFKTQFR